MGIGVVATGTNTDVVGLAQGSMTVLALDAPITEVGVADVTVGTAADAVATVNVGVGVLVAASEAEGNELFVDVPVTVDAGSVWLVGMTQGLASLLFALGLCF